MLKQTRPTRFQSNKHGVGADTVPKLKLQLQYIDSFMSVWSRIQTVNKQHHCHTSLLSTTISPSSIIKVIGPARDHCSADETMVNISNNNDFHTNAISLSRLETEELRDAFRLFDTENNGQVMAKDLKEIVNETLVESTGQKKANLEKVMHSLETFSDNDKLDFDCFCRIFTRGSLGDNQDELERIFGLFDDDAKGYIDINDLHKVAVDLGENLSEDELAEMIQRVSSTGKVTPDEFRTMMNKKLFS